MTLFLTSLLCAFFSVELNLMESSREDDVFEQQVLMQSVQQDPTGMAPGGLWVRVMKLEGVLACCCLKTSLGR